MITNTAIFLVLSVLLNCVYSQLDVGDECYHEEKKFKGKCVLLNECKSAIEDLLNKKNPQTCSFLGLRPLVCCPLLQTGLTAEKKCWEYSKSVYKIIPSINTFLNKEPLNISTCATPSTISDNGCLNVKITEFPHMAVLGYGSANNKKWKCSGTLISEQFILTTAHCLNLKEYGEVKFIRLGEQNLARLNEANPEDFYVKEIYKHPDYTPPSKYNDIALIEMDRPTKFNEFIRPACLQISKEIPVDRYLFTGWGQVQVGEERQSEHLQKINKYMITDEKCVDLVNMISGLYKGIDLETQICAKNGEDMENSCEMDRGGPLQINHPQAYCMHSVIGVSSSGTFQTVSKAPYIYTRVSNYIEWIEKIVWPIKMY